MESTCAFIQMVTYVIQHITSSLFTDPHYKMNELSVLENDSEIPNIRQTTSHFCLIDQERLIGQYVEDNTFCEKKETKKKDLMISLQSHNA